MNRDVAEATDYLKFAAARLLICQHQFRALQASGSPAADALALLGHVHTELSEAVGRFCPDGQNAEVWATRYDDGRPVISVMPIGPGVYVHAWHPDRTHPMNSRCDLDVITIPDGTRKQMVVSAPGCIDAVSLPEITADDDGQPALSQTE
jgi:hypothetical protein